MLLRGEAAGDGVVGDERVGERGLEVVDEAVGGEGRRRVEAAWTRNEFPSCQGCSPASSPSPPARNRPVKLAAGQF